MQFVTNVSPPMIRSEDRNDVLGFLTVCRSGLTGPLTLLSLRLRLPLEPEGVVLLASDFSIVFSRSSTRGSVIGPWRAVFTKKFCITHVKPVR